MHLFNKNHLKFSPKFNEYYFKGNNFFNCLRYIYSTPNPHALRGEDSNSNANPSSTPSSAAVSPIGGDRPPFRASSSSSHHHSPQHEADDTEASHSVHVNGRRGSSDDNDSSGLPEDGMIPLSGWF